MEIRLTCLQGAALFRTTPFVFKRDSTNTNRWIPAVVYLRAGGARMTWREGCHSSMLLAGIRKDIWKHPSVSLLKVYYRYIVSNMEYLCSWREPTHEQTSRTTNKTPAGKALAKTDPWTCGYRCGVNHHRHHPPAELASDWGNCPSRAPRTANGRWCSDGESGRTGHH